MNALAEKARRTPATRKRWVAEIITDYWPHRMAEAAAEAIEAFYQPQHARIQFLESELEICERVCQRTTDAHMHALQEIRALRKQLEDVEYRHEILES